MNITLTREEAQQVLELITNAYVSSQLAETLRARLAQPEPEPAKLLLIPALMEQAGWVRKREWQGLTDEEIKAMRHMRDWTAGWTDIKYAREIEAKLKEKNA